PLPGHSRDCLAHQSGAHQQSTVCFAGRVESDGLCRRQSVAELAFLGLERNASRPRSDAHRAHVAGYCDRTGVASFRLCRKWQLPAPFARKVSRIGFRPVQRSRRCFPQKDMKHQTIRTAVFLAALAAFAAASSTRTWTQADYGDFEKGVIKN